MHYLLLIVADGKSFEREYIALDEPTESKDSATERWILTHPTMVDRIRNRDKQAIKLRNSILERRICHPSSYYRVDL